jgi:hypothetical protein
MDKLPDTYDYPNLNQEAIYHLSRFITQNEIETATESLKKKSPKHHLFSAEFHQNFKEELIPTLHKLYHETEREQILLNSFYEASIIVIPKLKTHPKRRIIGQTP